MRRIVAVLSIAVFVGSSCGGDSNGDSGSASVTTTATEASASTTSTTEAPTTTLAPVPLVDTPELGLFVAAPAGYTYTPVGAEALGSFEVLVEDQANTGDLLDRYTTLAVASNGTPTATLLVLWVADAQRATADPSALFDIVDSLAPNVAGEGTFGLVPAMWGKVDTAASEWVSFVHEGAVLVTWGDSASAVEAFTGALITALHMAPVFTDITAMEANLPLMYVPLLPPCEFNVLPNYLISKRDQVKMGNSWREDPYLLAQHFAVRQVKCPPAQGELAITEFPAEFAGSGLEEAVLSGYTDTAKETWTISDVKVVLDNDGSVRWVQGHYFFQLFSDVVVSNRRQVFSSESLQAIATQMIGSGIALRS